MPQRTVTVASAQGLHARPASMFAEAAAAVAPVQVLIGRPGEEGMDASSILTLMALGAGKGEELVLSAEGEGAEDALKKLGDLIETDLDAQA